MCIRDRYSREETGKYKEVNIDLDRYTRAFDVIDVMYQSLRTVLNVCLLYTSKQRKGLHSKNVQRGVYVYASSHKV